MLTNARIIENLSFRAGTLHALLRTKILPSFNQTKA